MILTRKKNMIQKTPNTLNQNTVFYFISKSSNTTRPDLATNIFYCSILLHYANPIISKKNNCHFMCITSRSIYREVWKGNALCKNKYFNKNIYLPMFHDIKLICVLHNIYSRWLYIKVSYKANKTRIRTTKSMYRNYFWHFETGIHHIRSYCT